jgi:hypothetical protein
MGSEANTQDFRAKFKLGSTHFAVHNKKALRGKNCEGTHLPWKEGRAWQLSHASAATISHPGYHLSSQKKKTPNGWDSA